MDDFDSIEWAEITPKNPVQLSANEKGFFQTTVIKCKIVSDSILAHLYIDGELHFEDCEFVGKLEILKTFAQLTVFKNCIFQKPLIMKELESNINIIGCVFHQSVLVYWDPSVDASPIDIVDSKFLSSLTLNGCNDTKISIHSSKASDILIGEQSNNTFLEIIKSEINSLTISNSVILEMDIKISIISKSLISNIAQSILLDNTEIGNIVSDDPDFWLFIKKRRLIGPLFHRREREGKEMETKAQLWSRISQSLLVFIHSFEDDHRYSEADIVFYLMRFARINEQLNDGNIRNNITTLLQGFVYGIIGGWGVRLINPILSSLVIIVGYALIYFLDKLHAAHNAIVGQVLYSSLNLSIGRFFNIGESLYNIQYFRFVDGQEGVIGIIFITLIIGMFIRKMVR